MPHRRTKSSPVDNARIEAALLQCLAQRDPASSSCPSEVARVLAPRDERLWRALMPHIRVVAERLVREGRIVITRGSHILAPGELAGGPIRLRRGKRFDDR